MLKPDQTQDAEPAMESGAAIRKPGFVRQVSEWSAKHPILLVLLVSLLAVTLNCYPIVFGGRSFAASTGAAMVYGGRWPPLPGMPDDAPQTSIHGSDTAAMLVWAVPAGFIESRSLLEHGELPLWNRYGHAGYPFIGQAVTMLGDPLQLIVILGHGSAGAWDVKFLTAKFLFCAGFGLLVLRLLGNRGLAIIYTALAAYSGAFFYINNHPAYFVFCYAPWVMLSGLEMLDVASARWVRWGLVWLLANFACFNAGDLEAAVILIGGLNLTALVGALAQRGSAADWAKVLARVGTGTLLFLGLTAPVWLSFLTTLHDSYSAHSQTRIYQLPFLTLIGAFDDVFYLILRKKDSIIALAPAASLLIFTGCVLSALHWRRLKTERFWMVNSCATVLAGGCIFGWIPASCLAAVPLLNRVGHVDTDFSYWLVVLLTVQSAYGFKCLVETRNFRRAATDLLWAGVVLAGMTLAYRVGNYQQRPIPWNYVVCASAGAVGAPLLFAFLRSRYSRVPVFGWVGISLLALAAQFRFALYSFGNDDLLMLPGSRAVLNAPSPAIEKIQADHSAPFRVAGATTVLFGDYAAVYGLEDIRSCAPLSNGELIELIRQYPGIYFNQDWMIDLENPVAAHALLNLLNVKYLLADTFVGPKTRGDYPIVGRSDFTVLENPQAWPRAFFSDQVVPIASTEEFVQYLRDHGGWPFVALTPPEMEKQAGLAQLVATPVATIVPAANYTLLPNSTAFDVHAPSAGVVCLTEGQARDFTARANGQAKAVLTVNRAFKGVYLDRPGNYHIEFIYRPHYWKLACILFWIALGSAVGLALSAFISNQKAGQLRDRSRK